nr:Crp/Fnr family transcriptional regulator [Micromonospora sp. HNM0581]
MRGLRSTLYARAVPIRRVELTDGETLHQPGTVDGRVYLIESGAICLENYSPNGRRTILDVLPKNDYFGEDSLPGMPSQYTPSAITPTRLIVIENAVLHSLLCNGSIFDAWQYSQVLKARRHRSLLLQHATSDSEARLAMRLLDLTQTFGTGIGRAVRIDLKLRHEDYAAMIGTTRSRVGIFLQRFTDRKMIRKGPCGAIVADPRRVVEYIMERMGLRPTG